MDILVVEFCYRFKANSLEHGQFLIDALTAYPGGITEIPSDNFSDHGQVVLRFRAPGDVSALLKMKYSSHLYVVPDKIPNHYLINIKNQLKNRSNNRSRDDNWWYDDSMAGTYTDLMRESIIKKNV